MNSITLMGRLCADPEITSGTSKDYTIARFTLAVDRRFAKEGQQKTDFFICSAFGKLAVFAERYLTKGVKVIIQGEMRLDTVQKDGKNMTYPKVHVGEIEFCESKGEKPSNSPENDFTDIELPFE